VATLQEKLKTRLKSLNDLDGVSVEVTEDLGTIDIYHKLHHVADFKFKWVDGNHYVGYFIDSDQNKSQAIVSLWEPIEAVKFMALYTTLIDLKAKR